jgi:RNA chaperone Hfq
METNLLDRMLTSYQASHSSVTITLQNKIRVTGKIRAFDSYVIVVEGLKREILYRHAVSCIAPHAPDAQKRAVPASKPAHTKPATMPVKPSPQRPRQHRPQTLLAAGAADPGLNNSMKEGLLRWMQEQKAAK